jgi:hypothetical protein
MDVLSNGMQFATPGVDGGFLFHNTGGSVMDSRIMSRDSRLANCARTNLAGVLERICQVERQCVSGSIDPRAGRGGIHEDEILKKITMQKNAKKNSKKKYTAFGLPSWSPTLVLTELDPA